MTRKQARRKINSLDYYLQNHTDDYGEESHTAMMMAVKALEQEPCEDAISRQAVLDIAKLSKSNWIDNSVLFKRVNELPPVKPQEPTWIPVSEYGYPKPKDEYKNFLTIDNKGEITIQEFLLSLDEEPQPYFTGMRNIIAWMPLPKPYEPQEREEEYGSN